MKPFETFRSAILAGIAISCGGFVFLVLGGIPGAVAFTFGLLTVVHYKMKLFTGAIGFAQSWKETGDMFIILAGNVLGCLLVSLLARVSPLGLQETAQTLLEKRLATGALKCGALAIGCGFVVTTAVCFGRQDKWLPLLFGVPLFIICGFPHCIADAFYYLVVPFPWLGAHFCSVLGLWVCLVLGNAIGCNLYRIITWQK